MKYYEVINILLNDVNCGYENIQASSLDYKASLIAEINKAECSITTSKVFLGFVEDKMKNKEVIELGSTMLEAAIFVGNGLGLDPSAYCTDIRNRDLAELKALSDFKS